MWRARRIRVRPDLGGAHAAQALAHELGHVLLDGSIAYPPAASTGGCRGVRKVEADSVGFVVSARLGMDATGYSFPYVASWAGSDPRAQPEATVLAAGERIVAAATRIITHLDTVLPPRLVWHVDATPNLAGVPASRAGHPRQEAAVPAPAQTTRAPPDGPASRAPDTSQISAILSDAQRFFAGQVARSWVPGYLRDRGLDDTVAERWQIGYAPAGWTALTDHLRGLGHGDAEIEAAGLARRSSRGTLIDHFRDRAMLAIRDTARNRRGLHRTPAPAPIPPCRSTSTARHIRVAEYEVPDRAGRPGGVSFHADRGVMDGSGRDLEWHHHPAAYPARNLPVG